MKFVLLVVELVSEIVVEVVEVEVELEGAMDAIILDEAWGLVFDNFLLVRKFELDGFDCVVWEVIKVEYEVNLF